jgi:nucleoredoxin
MLPELKGNLVTLSGKHLKRFDANALAATKYFAIYYSASWCGPCRQFTPKLVEWYKAHKKDNPHFELIFVCNDNSEQDMTAYMAGDNMPWPAVDFKKKDRAKALTKYAGPGIPCLVFLDDQGKVLSDSYQGKTYLGPGKVMKDIETTLAQNPPSEAAKAAAAKPASASQSGSGSFDDFFKKK